MKLLPLTLLFLIGIAVAAPAAFTVDQYLSIAVEYDRSGNLVGADAFGPVDKEAVCEQENVQGIAASHGMLEPGHTLAATCMHIMFGGPLPKGAVALVPMVGSPLKFVIIAVGYSAAGSFSGAQVMHATPDPATCMKQARDVLAFNLTAGNVSAGSTLLLYCVPVPRMPTSTTPGGVSV